MRSIGSVVSKQLYVPDVPGSDLILVMLRQPRLSSPLEMRSDPFWEFGSFGCTGCHSRNLLNPRRAHLLEGARLGFVQGGAGEVRLVYITDPVTVRYHSRHCEILWPGQAMPLRYGKAPVVVSNSEYSDCPGIFKEIAGVDRSTPCGKFASKFRSRREPIGSELGDQVVAAYENVRSQPETVAATYEEALPYLPPIVDTDRAETYAKLLGVA